MTREEYLQKCEELDRAFADLKNEYINSNITYPVGTKLKVTSKNGIEVIGIVRRYYINGWDEVKYELAKVNKDGTAHKTATEYFYRNDIEKEEVIE